MEIVNQKTRGEEHKVDARTIAMTIPWRKVILYAVLALGFFLLGAVPMWMRAHETARERDAAQHELRLSQMQNSLSSAVIDARRGEYELARQTASDFYTSLRSQIDATGEASILTSTQRESLRPLLSQRDDIITLLARSDPAAADRLTNIYVAYRQAMNNTQPPGQS